MQTVITTQSRGEVQKQGGEIHLTEILPHISETPFCRLKAWLSLRGLGNALTVVYCYRLAHIDSCTQFKCLARWESLFQVMDAGKIVCEKDDPCVKGCGKWLALENSRSGMSCPRSCISIEYCCGNELTDYYISSTAGKVLLSGRCGNNCEQCSTAQDKETAAASMPTARAGK